MPKGSLTVETTVTAKHELKLSPALKKKLMTALKTYAELQEQAKAIEAAKKKQADIVEDIQVDLGESSISIEGFKATIVTAFRKAKTWKQTFVKMGGDIEILNRAEEASKVPGKAYVKITPPGGSDSDDDE